MTGQLFDHATDAPSGATRSGSAPGCRLQRLEVYNWGTFDKEVWTFDIGGRNALLTGDIGSGKSTLVDAVTTLLLPANRISYNKAAGADTRERDLRSYVLGHYKSERVETTGTTRPVGLRDASHYAVLVGMFANADFGDTVALAQVFRAREDGGQPERFFVVADTDLSVAKHFSDVGPDLASLKRRLREHGARIYDHFPDYGRDFRRRLGIESEQALDLFHQTVSMKAVDNLNDFVRAHMLEPFDTQSRVQSLIDHFDDLTKAHEAVVRARDQIDRLSPLMADLDAYDLHSATLDDLNRRRDAIPYYFAHRTESLLTGTLVNLNDDLSRLDREIDQRTTAERSLRETDQQLSIQIAGHGGNRLALIDTEIKRLEQDWPARREKLRAFNQRLVATGLDEVSVAAQFDAARTRIETKDVELKARLADIENELTDKNHEARITRDEATAVNDELRSLRSRQSKLPARSLEVREQLCDDLGLDGSDLPFAGELIQVRQDATEWEGAAERVLRNFGLSLLVPNEHYERVATWINQRHLGSRVVYYRVPARLGAMVQPDRRGTQPLLLDMLEVKDDSSFAPWLHNELARRADHLCVESVAEFRSATKAITREGQIKSRDRHEKDDRRRIDDRRDYVLGWSNEQKVDALIAHANALQRSSAPLQASIDELQAQKKLINESIPQLAVLQSQQTWDELDWQTLVAGIGTLTAEADRIRTSSDVLAALAAEQRQMRHQIEELIEHLRGLQRDRGKAEAMQTQAETHLAAVRVLLDDADALAIARDEFAAIDAFLAAMRAGADDLATIGEVQRSATTAVADRFEQVSTERQRLAVRVVRAMADFKTVYRQETDELDASIESAAEFRQFFTRVVEDDLPRFEHEFKRSLNENAIHEIAGLSAQLNSQVQTIRDRVDKINGSLQTIDYNPGRYIHLVPEATPNTEIRQFREDLRTCTSQLTQGPDDDQYSEARFLQVKAIIDRFKGREGMVDQDRTWTRRVTDVRQWFVFSASERWREDDAEHESYTDSAGKSGGQKEKLAYTILAASLAYQFKLNWQGERSKAFRFVVIDEAFGRGSDDSTRYALELFTNLGLQLLIVTPLQKIHVIEPHVSSVGFVDNLNGNYSRLQCLTIEEHRRRRSTNNGAAERSDGNEHIRPSTNVK